MLLSGGQLTLSMQVFGQMARVVVTARQKFNEAAYFYNGMIAQRLNVVILILPTTEGARRFGSASSRAASRSFSASYVSAPLRECISPAVKCRIKEAS
jgi:hypothetical protein